MSWFTDLAGKAEELLNKVDQTAAVAFQKDENGAIIGPGSRTLQQPHFVVSQKTDGIPPGGSLAMASLTGSSLQKPPNSPGHFSKSLSKSSQNLSSQEKCTVQKSKSKEQIEDEALFQFLNEPEAPKPKTQKTAIKLSDDESSLRLNEKVKASSATDSAMKKSSLPDSVSVNSSNNIRVGALPDAASLNLIPQAKPVVENVALQNSPSLQSPHVSVNVSNVELENRMLRNEIASLNQELALSLQRSKASENEMQQLRKRIEQCSAQLSAEETTLREFQERDKDLRQALEAKDTQLAVLRVRLQEADQELLAKRESVENLEKEKQRILDDHTSSSGLHTQTIQTVQERLQQAEESLEIERSNFKKAQNDSVQRISRLEEELKVLASNYSEVQTKYVEEKSHVTELSNQIRSLRNNLQSTQQELADYKNKAQRILQSKERLIATLKENGAGKTDTDNQTENTAATLVELEELRHERDLLKDEVLQCNHKISSLQSEILEVESMFQNEVATSRDRHRELEEAHREERERKMDLETEISQMKQELKYMHDDYSRQTMTLQSRIKSRDEEIEKLRKQLMAKQVNTSSQLELEARLNSLTESLIQKQTVVEALSTEKTSLVLQLERTEQQLNQMTANTRQTSSMTVNVADDNDVRLRFPGFMVETPFDGKVARKVKRVYNSIDTFSVRLGVFLRRYPMARTFVIAYMILLHFWVMIVLLTYKPEIHDTEYPSNKSHF